TALDELPTLIHILKGEISFVGPKALAPIVYDDTDPDHGKSIHEVQGLELRSRVSPGLTGLAQVYASKNCPYRHKFRYDSIYIKHLAFGLDIKLIVMSFLRTFIGGWEKTSRRR
ncbi:sugar transferase, partial [Dehalococcoidia bacterium]|nr:sugar transferase [Dehalococcoidia bacterium]